MADFDSCYGTWFSTLSSHATKLTPASEHVSGSNAFGALTCAVPATPWLVSHGGKSGLGNVKLDRVFGVQVRVMDLSRGGDDNAAMPWLDFPAVNSSELSILSEGRRRYFHAGFISSNVAGPRKDDRLPDYTVEEKNPLRVPLASLRNHSLYLHGGIDEAGEVRSDWVVFNFGTGRWDSPGYNKRGSVAAPLMYGHQVLPTQVQEPGSRLILPGMFVVGVPSGRKPSASRKQLVLSADSAVPTAQEAAAQGQISVYVCSDLSGWRELFIIADQPSSLAPRRHFLLSQADVHHPSDDAAAAYDPIVTFFMVGGNVERTYASTNQQDRRRTRGAAAHRETGTHHEMSVVEIVWHRAESPAAMLAPNPAAPAQVVGEHVVFREILGPWCIASASGGGLPVPPPSMLQLSKLRRTNWILSRAQDAVRGLQRSIHEAELRVADEVDRASQRRTREKASGAVVQPLDVAILRFDELPGIDKMLQLGEDEKTKNAAQVGAAVARWMKEQQMKDDTEESDDDDDVNDDDNKKKKKKTTIAGFKLKQWKSALFFFVYSPVCIDMFALVPPAAEEEQVVAAWPPKLQSTPVYVPLASLPMRGLSADISARTCAMESIRVAELPQGAAVYCSSDVVDQGEARLLLEGDAGKKKGVEKAVAIYAVDQLGRVLVSVGSHNGMTELGTAVTKNLAA